MVVDFQAWLVGVALADYVGIPVVLAWGWARWLRRERARGVLPTLSAVSFALATASALLAAGTILYARLTGGFEYYDPRLMKIYASGLLLSLAALALAAVGVWRRSGVRWLALVAGFATLLLWVFSAASE